MIYLIKSLALDKETDTPIFILKIGYSSEDNWKSRFFKLLLP